MSKSDACPGSSVLLTDSPDTIRMKVRRAQTDSLQGVTYDSVGRPGISNLIRILAAVEKIRSETDIELALDYGLTARPNTVKRIVPITGYYDVYTEW
ncbi:unnamed protein product [Echinostoma caproni]|uniref:tRNA-synt_2c domain-containing protein n=1 Tax=Echinostoma caproni TaxID=27848 RepID=A0A183BCI1_9TREM|nr:unnamed protein product [Echinostoma caproni]